MMGLQQILVRIMEAVGHIVSTIRKQRVIDSDAQLTHFFFAFYVV